MDKTKVVFVLCVVMTAVVVAVVAIVAVGSIVYFRVTDGGWTSWGDWGTCSVTCGGGLMARSRTCSNPQPTSIGKYCDGTSEQMKICNNFPCSVTDGGWTSWGDWGTCSVTCGGGLMARSRTCSNPQPTSIGKYCDGTSEQMKICNNFPCSACQQPKVTGPCMGMFHRYFYNTQTSTCEQFIYGGCWGNDNNFEVLQKCETVCMSGI